MKRIFCLILLLSTATVLPDSYYHSRRKDDNDGVKKAACFIVFGGAFVTLVCVAQSNEEEPAPVIVHNPQQPSTQIFVVKQPRNEYGLQSCIRGCMRLKDMYKNRYDLHDGIAQCLSDN